MSKINATRINLNDEIYVSLTDYAWGIVDNMAMGKEIRKILEMNTSKACVFGLKPNPCKMTRIQLWEFMQYFGKHIFNGCTQIIHENAIFLPGHEELYLFDEEEKEDQE